VVWQFFFCRRKFSKITEIFFVITFFTASFPTFSCNFSLSTTYHLSVFLDKFFLGG
jgi:hypothetical protein